jgi:hypothetical protein
MHICIVELVQNNWFMAYQGTFVSDGFVLYMPYRPRSDWNLERYRVLQACVPFRFSMSRWNSYLFLLPYLRHPAVTRSKHHFTLRGKLVQLICGWVFTNVPFLHISRRGDSYHSFMPGSKLYWDSARCSRRNLCLGLGRELRAGTLSSRMMRVSNGDFSVTWT